MLMLLCEVSGGRYLIDCAQVCEMIPRVELKPFMPAASAGFESQSSLIAGLLTYRNGVIPILDVSQLLYQRPSLLRLSSRIVIVKTSDETSVFTWGLLTERVVNSVPLEAFEVVQTPSNVIDPSSIWGPLLVDQEGMVQQLRLEPLAIRMQEQLRPTLQPMKLQPIQSQPSSQLSQSSQQQWGGC